MHHESLPVPKSSLIRPPRRHGSRPTPLRPRKHLTEEEKKAHSLYHQSRMINYTIPDLKDIVNDKGEIVRDPQFLLDFAIVGFGMCGTSTIMHWLAEHPEVKSFREEVWELMYQRPDKLIQLLYLELPPGFYKRGYKVQEAIEQVFLVSHVFACLGTW